ncbi:MAG: L-seryl-tRNA(Sec) selenium transferase [Anaerolineaceae bacterium]|nr:L-seryl-tRNA(Sec) selenium transferase [Anaerolineaceae bacterium]
MTDGLRSIPSVDQLLSDSFIAELIPQYGRSLVVKAVRSSLQHIRQASIEGTLVGGSIKEIRSSVENWLISQIQVSIQPVINASGVIIHTNLGRAPLSEEAIQAILSIAGDYSNLEYDLAKGKRGKRADAIEQKLIALTGAEDAFVVNNNASAVLLVLAALARRKRVVISRTQLIEIGGGFRIPEVLQQSGAKLYEIGSTNRVHLQDYADALQNVNAVILRAHHSNFKIIGFTKEPSLKELVELAAKEDHLVIDDLGSGAILDTSMFNVAHEPTVQESIQAGADVVCFSGDKLFGGPQAGMIVGKREVIKKIKKHPFARAVRADKLCLAALEATISHYLKDEALQKIPIWRMLSMPVECCEQRVVDWKKVLKCGEMVDGLSTIGGGSMPQETLPTKLFALSVSRVNVFMKALRSLKVPIVARVIQDQIVFDPRTVLPAQERVFLTEMETLIKKFDIR